MCLFCSPGVSTTMPTALVMSLILIHVLRSSLTLRNRTVSLGLNSLCAFLFTYAVAEYTGDVYSVKEWSTVGLYIFRKNLWVSRTSRGSCPTLDPCNSSSGWIYPWPLRQTKLLFAAIKPLAVPVSQAVPGFLLFPIGRTDSISHYNSRSEVMRRP